MFRCAKDYVPELVIRVLMWVQFLKGPPSKIWEGGKMSKIWRDLILTTFDFDREYLRNG